MPIKFNSTFGIEELSCNDHVRYWIVTARDVDHAKAIIKLHHITETIKFEDDTHTINLETIDPVGIVQTLFVPCKY